VQWYSKAKRRFKTIAKMLKEMALDVDFDIGHKSKEAYINVDINVEGIQEQDL